jgi:hypothetical protein
MEAIMNKKFLLVPLVVLTLVSLACSVTINLPDTKTKVGDTVSETINVPLPANQAAPAEVSISFGAGTLKIQPGATEGIISGTARYNVAELKPVVTTNGNSVSVTQGSFKLKGLPTLGSDVINEWNLALANTPLSLVIKAGAYEGNYELGGLSINRLEVTDGASKVNLGFTNPNLVEMTTLKYSTGASEVKLSGLGNANVDAVSFTGGAGSYTLDFSGTLQRNMTVSIDSGVSSVTILVPTGVAAQVTSESSLTSVMSSSSWQQSGNTYQQSGSGYKITILVKMGAGSLQLENSK